MHRNEEQTKFQCRIISIANANTHCSHWLTLRGRAAKGGKIRFLCEGHDVVDFNYSVLSSFQVLTSAK